METEAVPEHLVRMTKNPIDEEDFQIHLKASKWVEKVKRDAMESGLSRRHPLQKEFRSQIDNINTFEEKHENVGSNW